MLFKEKRFKRYGHKGPSDCMSTQLDNDLDFHFDSEQFQQKLPLHYRSILSDFRKCSSSFVLFNLFFLCLACVEILSFCVFLTALNGSAVIALVLGSLFLTFFSYFVLLFYFQARKPEQLNELLERFITSCRTSLGIPLGVALHHLSVAETLIKLAQYLTDYEWRLIKIPNFLSPFSKIISRFFAYCYWRDVCCFKQLLLQAAIDEHLNQIRLTPTDLEVHASLANAYVALSQVYKEPKKQGQSHPRQNFYRRHATLFEEKCKASASLAIGEFQILNQYAPNDPWIHEQLSTGYRELGLPQEEIREVEFLLTLRPNDREILFRLGTLYFEQGLNAKGLQVYEELKKANFKKAEHLISNYGRGAQPSSLLFNF